MKNRLTGRSLVIMSLQNPREKIWGMLVGINSFGVTIHGIDINSFDDWSRSVAGNAETIGLTTMFVPMLRVEKVILDESIGSYKALSEQFLERVGMSVIEYLGVGEEEDEDPLDFS
jgi:hypothetical protein